MRVARARVCWVCVGCVREVNVVVGGRGVGRQQHPLLRRLRTDGPTARAGLGARPWCWRGRWRGSSAGGGRGGTAAAAGQRTGLRRRRGESARGPGAGGRRTSPSSTVAAVSTVPSGWVTVVVVAPPSVTVVMVVPSGLRAPAAGQRGRGGDEEHGETRGAGQRLLRPPSLRRPRRLGCAAGPRRRRAQEGAPPGPSGHRGGETGVAQRRGESSAARPRGGTERRGQRVGQSAPAAVAWCSAAARGAGGALADGGGLLRHGDAQERAGGAAEKGGRADREPPR